MTPANGTQNAFCLREDTLATPTRRRELVYRGLGAALGVKTMKAKRHNCESCLALDRSSLWNQHDHSWILEADRREGILSATESIRGPALIGSRSDSAPAGIRIGVALGGGFARGIAHAGVLKVLQQFSVPIHCITGVSAGAIVAAAYASGTSPDEIAQIGCSMRFRDVARWSPRLLGLVGSERMKRFLKRILKTHRFEEMTIPLGVVATDLSTGQPVPFSGTGEVFDTIRASCSYPGLFRPVRRGGRLLVDGAMSMEIPAELCRQLGATHVISVQLPARATGAQPNNMLEVIHRCFQILQSTSEHGWREETDLVIAPEVGAIEWNGFTRSRELVQAGEAAALSAIPKIQEWLKYKWSGAMVAA
jgi:NTE family protein